MRTTTVLILLFSLVLSHEICRDFSGSTTNSNTYCSVYSGKTCCSIAKDAELSNFVQSLGITDQNCLGFIQQTTCATCDPWGGHLFGSESGTPLDFPRVCTAYCGSFYQACGNVNINWPSGKNPFGTSSSKLSDHFSSQADFCDTYQPLNNVSACFSGVKFVPSEVPVPPPGETKFCLEDFSQWTNGVKPIKLVDPNIDSGEFYVAYQNGTLAAVSNATGNYIRTIIQLEAHVNNEMGFLGLALHPNYANNGKLYVFYTRLATVSACVDSDWCHGEACNSGFCGGRTQGSNLLEEWTYIPGQTAIKLRTILQIQKYAMNHNGGDMTFGADGYLYISVGDGGDRATNAQNLMVRTGKILRYDVDSTNYVQGRNYAVPSDNPGLSAKFPEVFAYGFRNPWRMSFDSLRPTYLFVGDVGEGDVEEWDLVVKGGNYGWPNYEGNRRRNVGNVINDRKNPIIEVGHNLGAYSAIGGYLNRGKRDPCSYGKYIFADWASNVGMMYAYESPVNSGNFSFDFSTQRMTVKCKDRSCSLGVHAMSQDSQGNIYLHDANRTYRQRELSFCSWTCNDVIPTEEPAVATRRTSATDTGSGSGSGSESESGSGTEPGSGTNSTRTDAMGSATVQSSFVFLILLLCVFIL